MTSAETGPAPEEKSLPAARSLAITVLRQRRGLKQLDLARLIDYTSTAVSYLESGKREVQPRVLLTIATVLGYSRDDLEALVFGLSAFLGTPDTLPAETGLQPAEIEEIARRAMRRGLLEARESLQRMVAEAQAQRRATEREDAARRYREIANLNVVQQEVLLETRPELQTWAMVERLCEESARAATDEPKRALLLGNLALRCSHSPLIPSAFRSRLEGYAWAFIANARRVGSDLPGAQEAFRLAWESWRKVRRGASELPLGAWRIQDLEASLKRAQRRGRASLILLARALRTAPTSARGRLLLKRATTLEMMGQNEKAVSTLYEASEWISATNEPGHYFALRFNLAVNLQLCGRAADANALLPELRELAVSSRSGTHLNRVTWLQARVAGSLGEHIGAKAGLEQVHREFTRKGFAYDAALSALELAGYLLREVETERTLQLAKESMWIFHAQGVDQAALSAFRLFCDAAIQRAASVELVERALRAFWRARALPD